MQVFVLELQFTDKSPYFILMEKKAITSIVKALAAYLSDMSKLMGVILRFVYTTKHSGPVYAGQKIKQNEKPSNSMSELHTQ